MANNEHLQILGKGADKWNNWRKQNRTIRPDLREADLSGFHLSGFHLSEANLSEADLSEAHLFKANLSGADLSEANLSEAHLSGADLSEANLREAHLREAHLSYADLREAHLSEADLIRADLSGADLREANLREADLRGADLFKANLSYADLSGADLSEAHLSEANLFKANLSYADLFRADLSYADLSGADLSEANLSGADLSGADLSGADLSEAKLNQTILIQTNLCNANLAESSIYGIAAWDIQLEGAIQRNLVITPDDQPVIMVDNLEVAQFIYLLLHNPKIRQVIDTVAQKAVLILGRFTETRKPILEAIRTALRAKGYVPILFDFEKPRSQDLTETVSTLAHLSRFIIADLTDPSCSPYEIREIAPSHIKPIQPLFQPSKVASHEFAMLKDLQQRYYWVLPTYPYHSVNELIASLQNKVIEPAEQMIIEIEKRKT